MSSLADKDTELIEMKSLGDQNIGPMMTYLYIEIFYKPLVWHYYWLSWRFFYEDISVCLFLAHGSNLVLFTGALFIYEDTFSI